MEDKNAVEIQEAGSLAVKGISIHKHDIHSYSPFSKSKTPSGTAGLPTWALSPLPSWPPRSRILYGTARWLLRCFFMGDGTRPPSLVLSVTCIITGWEINVNSQHTRIIDIFMYIDVSFTRVPIEIGFITSFHWTQVAFCFMVIEVQCCHELQFAWTRIAHSVWWWNTTNNEQDTHLIRKRREFRIQMRRQ